MKNCLWMVILLVCSHPLQAPAADITGRIDLHHVLQLDHHSPGEEPGLTALITVDGQNFGLGLHGVFKGVQDGTVAGDGRDASLFKDFSHVYQDNSPFIEIKELYMEKETEDLDCRIGIQRFSWGRLDEYPVNDLLNPWEYNRIFATTLVDRKIGVPSFSFDKYGNDLRYQLVWVPWFVPYRIPEPDRRWSVIPVYDMDAGNAEISGTEPHLPARNLGNSSIGLRIQSGGSIDWAINFFHGIDPRPAFQATTLTITRQGDRLLIDPGYVPLFNPVTVIGIDGAAVVGDWSLRAEAAFSHGRTFTVWQGLWGYPETLEPGTYPLNRLEVRRNTLDYGIAADHRLKEDWLLTLQAQQTEIFNRPNTIYEDERETLIWVNLRIDRLIERLIVNLNIAVNPEHGATMIRPTLSYTLNDSWKLTMAGLMLSGPAQSLFGRYADCDQVETTLTYAW